MAVTLSPLAGAGQQFFDNNGNPLTGGKLYTYSAGTTAPLATYTTSSGAIAHTNPIILDSAGRVPSGGEIWLTVGIGYKFVLATSTDVVLATYDNIPSSAQPPAANDADSIQYEQGYTVTAGGFTVGQTYRILTVGNTNFTLIGAASNTVGVHFVATGAGTGTGTAELSRTVETKLREWVSVIDFGADPTGVADSTTAIANAYSNTTGTVYFPPGTYLISSSITQTANTVGAGQFVTTVKATPSLSGTAWIMFGGQFGISLEDITIASSRTSANETYNQTGLWDRGAVNNRITNVRIQGFDVTSLEIGRSAVVSGSYWSAYQNIRCYLSATQTAQYGVYIHGTGLGINSNDNTFINVIVSGAYTVPYYVGGNGNVFIAGGSEHSTGAAVSYAYDFDGSSNTVINPYIEYTTNKPKFARFSADSANNLITQNNSIYRYESSNTAAIVDNGLNNRVSFSSISGNFSDDSVVSDWSENMMMNAQFSAWRTASAPWGFTDTATVTRDTAEVIDGAYSSMKMTIVAATSQANFYLLGGTTNNYYQYPASMFAGKEIYFSTWCKTTIANAGCIKITVVAPSGNQNLTSTGSVHSGDGSWQLLSMIAKIKEDATTIITSFASSISSTNLTGDIYFCSPVIKVRSLKYVDRVSTSLPVITGTRLRISNQTDGICGSVVLVGGTATVANTSILASSLIFVSAVSSSGTAGELTVTRSAGVSFTITSSNALDTRTIAYFIVEPI